MPSGTKEATMAFDLEQIFNRELDRYISEWKELLRFPSISMEAEHKDNCNRCAKWLCSHLETIGFSSETIETSSHPLVFAERKGNPSSPTILYYGHYDVQPVDPIDAWDSPPFEPELRDNRMYARGAQDNKGQIFYSIKALETVVSAGKCKPTIKILIEGDEEFGSKGIADALPELKHKLKADLLLVTDTGTVGSGAPTIIMGLRGILHMSLTLKGPRHDLHSGVHGGAALNPAIEMCRLLSSLHDRNGRIAIKGFYDDVKEPTTEERELANAGFDMDSFVADLGMQPIAGEKDYTPAERIALRPSIDVNGMCSGYTGAGIKTVIPAEASAKLSARLVPDQDAQRCQEMIIEHLRERVPEGMTLSIPERTSTGGILRIDPTSAAVARAKEVLQKISDKNVALHWEGASIPIVCALAEASEAEPLLIGFGAQEHNIHAPNEFFPIDRFKQGFMYVASMILSFE